MGAEDDVHPGRLLHDEIAVLLGHAATDCDLHAGVRILDGAHVAEVSVEAVVRVLSYCAGVEHHDVGVLRRAVTLGGNHASFVEETADPFGVVHVHLAPVGDHVIAALSHNRTRITVGAQKAELS